VIDALLYGARDLIRSAGLGYGVRECEIMPDGRPTPRCGDVFVAVYELPSRSTNDNCLMEYFGFGVTLTMRAANTSYDRIGDTLLARRGPQALAREIGFNQRAEALRAFLHMNWAVIGAANNLIAEWTTTGLVVYGFCEPARYRGMETPTLVGGDWFLAQPDAEDVGLKAELRFEDARRLQPIALYA